MKYLSLTLVLQNRPSTPNRNHNSMPKLILFILVTFIGQQSMSGQTIPIPKNYSIVESVTGDLDKDGKDELVVAYDTQKQNEELFESVPRELIIYKNQNNNWMVWKKSSQALLGSRDGGMMGDPFGEIEIKNTVLLISQSGGSSWKWGYTDKYRYQDGEFYLIGYSNSGGRNCDHWSTVDFNLLTGKMIVEKEYERCESDDEAPEIYKRENETIYKMGLKITLQKRNEKEIKLTTPKYKHEVYIAITDE